MQKAKDVKCVADDLDSPEIGDGESDIDGYM